MNKIRAGRVERGDVKTFRIFSACRNEVPGPMARLENSPVVIIRAGRRFICRLPLRISCPVSRPLWRWPDESITACVRQN